MVDERYTPEGLPVLTEELIAIIKREVERQTSEVERKIKVFGRTYSREEDLMLYQEKKNFCDNNLILYRYLSEEIKETIEQKIKECEEGFRKFLYELAMSTAIATYGTLRRQAECNKLEEGLNNRTTQNLVDGEGI